MQIGEHSRLETDGNHAYALVPGALRLSMSEGELSAEGMLVVSLKWLAGRWLVDSLTWGGLTPA